MNFDLVSQRFQKAHQHYLKHAIIQKQIVHRLMSILHTIPMIKTAHRVLEIGCGSGYLTQQYLQDYQPTYLYLNDLYADIMQNDISALNVFYQIGDIQALDLSNLKFDLILSSSALQWIYPLHHLLDKLYQSLESSGYLIFSSFLNDNLKQIKQLTNQGLNYYTLDQLKEQLIQSGFDVQNIEQDYQTLYFNQAYDVLRHLKHTGVTATQNTYYWNKQRLKQFEQNYQAFMQNEQYPLTYHAVYVVAKKW